MAFQIIEADAAKTIGAAEKWARLSPFLRQYGREALSYATLQQGLEYFITDYGYVAYVTARHPVFAPKPKRITFADPVCATQDYPRMIRDFLSLNPHAVFCCVSESCATVLHDLRFKVNCVGCEVELPIQAYNTKGNWKELDMIKRARNEAQREGLAIREVEIETVPRAELAAVSSRWIGTKMVNDREIWFFARRPVFESEPEVRKFVAYDREGHLAGFVFYDPIYCDGQVTGYSATVSRCNEQRYGRLATAVHMEAMDRFKPEGKAVLNLNLAPFMKLEQGRFNDDWGSRVFFQLSTRYGNAIYNFQGLSFHKSKYRGNEKYLYYASNSLLPSNDIYLAFHCADITRSYFSTLGQLLWGMLTVRNKRQSGHSGR
jgi:lysylphosphatidylglycerol synthetase-like protein (DUF2156 family)